TSTNSRRPIFSVSPATASSPRAEIAGHSTATIPLLLGPNRATPPPSPANRPGSSRRPHAARTGRRDDATGMTVPRRPYIAAATTGGQGSSAKGIVIADVDGARLTPVGVGADDVENPMYLAMPDGGRVLYTVHEAGEGRVSAWQVDDDTLRPLGESRPTGGNGPCHLSIHPSGRYLLTADYGSGSISVQPIADDGSLGEWTALVQP